VNCARMSALQESEPALKVNAVPCGASSTESFASLDRDGCWRKTYQGYYQATMDDFSEEYCETWPRAGMMSNGTAYLLRPLVPLISVIGFTSSPTPQSSDGRRCHSTFGSCLRRLDVMGEVGTGDEWLNPEYSEWLMGFPPGWTDLSA